VNPSPCDNCGLCCNKLIIEIQHIDVVRAPNLLPIVQLQTPDRPRDSLWENEYMLACGSAMPCGMLTDDLKCSIYPTRPNVCISFEVGSEQCQTLREDYGLPPLYSKES
jgi:Fe-S-cluster containining protein